MEVKDIASIIAAITALLAVLIGPFVTLTVAKRQTDASKGTADLQARANVLSKSRQEWINTLRNEIAGFVSSMGHMSPSAVASATNGGNTLQLTKDVRLHYAKVHLLINPNEPDHHALVNKMALMIEQLSQLRLNFDDANFELAALAQQILKREWERVKAFE
jgi:hypothetical protein